MANLTVFASVGDGYTGKDDGGVGVVGSFSTIRSGDADEVAGTSSTAQARLWWENQSGNGLYKQLQRIFIPFSLSALQAGDTITAATLQFYVTSKTDDLHWGDDLSQTVELIQ